MLICPQCQFENPNHHKFCQKCGYSLTQKSCGECGLTVAINDLDCPHCGTRSGTVWLAIISSSLVASQDDSISDIAENSASSEEIDRLRGAITQIPEETQTEIDIIPGTTPVELELELTPDQISADDENHQDSVDSVASETSDQRMWVSAVFDASEIPPSDALQSSTGDDSSELESESSADVSLEKGMYLDENQRYQLIESATLQPGKMVTVPVLDTQPLQMSPLQAAPALLSSPEKMDVFVIAAAQAYFTLATQFQEHFPLLQDAWKSDQYTVVLLKDLSRFPTLLEKFSHQQTSPQQILDWLEQMADLWEILENFQMRQSLLELTNLRVYPSFPHSICLQQLYAESENYTLSLFDLGGVWKALVEKSQRTLFGSLTQLMRDLCEGEIETIAQLQDQLIEVREEFYSSSTEPESLPISTPTRIQLDQEDDTDLGILEANSAPTVPDINQLFHLQAVGATDIGRKRQRNEDSFGVQTIIHEQQTPQGRILEAKGLYILCDGMGGHAGGEVASQLAVDTLKQYFQSQWTGELPSREMIDDAIVQANSTIYEINQQAVRSGIGRMGTTLVMAIVVDHQVAIAHVGDSRLYRLTRSQGIKQVTVDHEVGQREILRGVTPEVAYTRPDAYQLTQALGPRDHNFVKPDIQFLKIEEDTVLILASDGLTDNDLLEIYHGTHIDPLLDPQMDLNVAVHQLIELANEHNGHDNITIIVIRLLVLETPKSNAD